MDLRSVIIGICLLLIAGQASALITDLKVPATIRLGENLTISGKYTAANALCKFIILDSNGFAIERLSDEYTFDDSTFYSQRQVLEPPYYRGDDFNAVVSCGTDQANATFVVQQPTSLAHPIQQGWDYFFEQPNVDSIMLFGGLLALVISAIAIFVWIIKRLGSYAG